MSSRTRDFFFGDCTTHEYNQLGDESLCCSFSRVAWDSFDNRSSLGRKETALLFFILEIDSSTCLTFSEPVNQSRIMSWLVCLHHFFMLSCGFKIKTAWPISAAYTNKHSPNVFNEFKTDPSVWRSSPTRWGLELNNCFWHEVAIEKRKILPSQWPQEKPGRDGFSSLSSPQKEGMVKPSAQGIYSFSSPLILLQNELPPWMAQPSVPFLSQFSCACLLSQERRVFHKAINFPWGRKFRMKILSCDKAAVHQHSWRNVTVPFKSQCDHRRSRFVLFDVICTLFSLLWLFCPWLRFSPRTSSQDCKTWALSYLRLAILQFFFIKAIKLSYVHLTQSPLLADWFVLLVIS